MSNIVTDFSAKEPSLGYFYQIKYSLLLLISKTKELDYPKLKIENLDDIEIADVNNLQLFQTKLHIKSQANLTDASVDFWKTIRIWSEHIENGLIDLDNTIFSLLTTEKISDDSVLHNFKKENLTEAEIKNVIKKLDLITVTTNNQSNLKAFKAYSKLSVDNKKKLISRIRIYDNAIGIEEINKKIKKEVALFIYPQLVNAFIEILEGWWFRKAIDNLQDNLSEIDGGELQLKIADIRDSFSADNLPNHFPDQLEVSDSDIETFKEKTFLKQLSIVELNVTSNTVKRAISDFRRAFEQRSKWLRLQLLNPDEEEEFDKRLYDHWMNIFEILCDECSDKDVQELKRMGKHFYLEQFAKTCPQIKIREKFKEDYLTRGSYQMLADLKKIGWHPKFKDEI